MDQIRVYRIVELGGRAPFLAQEVAPTPAVALVTLIDRWVHSGFIVEYTITQDRAHLTLSDGTQLQLRAYAIAHAPRSTLHAPVALPVGESDAAVTDSVDSDDTNS